MPDEMGTAPPGPAAQVRQFLKQHRLPLSGRSWPPGERAMGWALMLRQGQRLFTSASAPSVRHFESRPRRMVGAHGTPGTCRGQGAGRPSAKKKLLSTVLASVERRPVTSPFPPAHLLTS